MSDHESLYDDWKFLAGVGAALPRLAAQYGVEIPTGTSVKCTQERAKAVDELLTIAKPWPGEWTELAERLHGDRWLRFFINSHIPHSSDWFTRGAIVNDVLCKLMFVIIRNAEKWHDLGNHDQNWQGWVRCQLPRLVVRTVQAEAGADLEHTNADDPDRGGWISQASDPREMTPPEQVDFNEGLDEWDVETRRRR